MRYTLCFPRDPAPGGDEEAPGLVLDNFSGSTYGLMHHHIFATTMG